MTDVTTIDRSEVEAQVRKAMEGSQLAAVVAKFKAFGGRVLEKPDAKTGDERLVLDVGPLKDEDDDRSVDYRFEEAIWITMPYTNTQVPGHTVSVDKQEKTARIFHALFPDRIPFVSWQRPGGGKKTKDEYDAELTTVLVDSMILAYEIKANPKILEGRTFYAKTKPREGGKGSWFNSLYAEKPADWVLTDPSQFLKV